MSDSIGIATAKRPWFSIRGLMIVTAVVGILLELVIEYQNNLPLLVFSLVVSSFLYGIMFAVSRLASLTYRQRLAVEVFFLFAVLILSARMRMPVFYSEQEHRCERLAFQASLASAGTGANRQALAREATWFSRRAFALRWRGLWRGLTNGSSTRDMMPLGDVDLIYQMGVLESIERHEKAMIRATSRVLVREEDESERPTDTTGDSPRLDSSKSQ